jgi:precorrin-3B synthase
MATGDGLLLRIRPRIGRLTAAEARVIAAVARAHGNGLIDLTSRGNLQLRGLTPETLDDAQARLAAAGLLDATAEAEAMRNVLVSPLTGLDPTAVCDASGPARALEAMLTSFPTLLGKGTDDPSLKGRVDPRRRIRACPSSTARSRVGTVALGDTPPPPLRGGPSPGGEGWGRVASLDPFGGETPSFVLPDKFLWLVDDGGAVPLDNIPADVRFRAVPDDAGYRWAMGLDSSEGPAWVGSCDADALPATAERLARAFVTVAGAARRMRELDPEEREELIARAGLDASGQNAAAAEGASRPGEGAPLPSGERAGVRGEDPSCVSAPPSHPAAARPTSPRRGEVNARPSTGAEQEISGRDSPVVGLWPLGERCILTVAAPFGRMTADGLDQLAAVAEEYGTAELRFGPWRQVHIPGAAGMNLAPALEQAAAAGFITDPRDARLAIAACPGKPACASGQAAAQADAAFIANEVPVLATAGLTLHVSGCAKGCARPGETVLTLIGDNGRYGLVRGASTRATPLAQMDAAGAAAGLTRLAAAGGATALARLTNEELRTMFEAADG